MDLTFSTLEGKFNYRVAAVIIYDKKLLITRKKLQPYFFLPGGRVKLYETAEQALKRELKEELGEELHIVRPLWMVQSFFCESVRNEKFHEICLYYLVNVLENSKLLENESFERKEKHQEYQYYWCNHEKLSNYKVYPEFITNKLEGLPRTLELISFNTISE